MAKFFRKIKFMIISICLIFIVIGAVVYADLFSQKKSNSLPSSTEVSKNVTPQNTTNILLLDNKSDSMVVASVDKENKNIQFTPVTNTGYFDRSNMDNLLTTIEKKINMNLDKFLQVDTSELIDVISVLGDVSVNIDPEDMKVINNLIPKFYAEYENSNKGDMELIKNAGTQNINEYQAMAYVSAVAKDSSKQMEVILSLFENVKSLGFTKYWEIYNKLKPYVETNLTIPDMLQLASTDYKFE